MPVLIDGLRARVHLEFFVNAADVGVDGRHADAERFGDFLVEVAFAQEIEDGLFARRECFEIRGARGGRETGKGLHYLACDAAAHGRAAGHDLRDGFEEFGASRTFEEVACRAGGKRGEDVVGVFVDREHQKLGAGHRGLELAHGLDAIHFREVDIDEHDVGRFGGESLDGGSAAVVLADEFEVGGAGDKFRQYAAGGVVVFNDGNPDFHGWGVGEAAISD